MSSENDLDLDAILAEFHAGEQRPAAPAESPAPRRRRAESAPVTEDSPTAPSPRQPRPVPPRRESTPAREEDEPPVRPAKKPQPAPRAERERRPASRKARGRLHMTIALAALLAILVGMLFWTIGEERKAAALEPEPQRIELGQGLEDYLDHAASTSYG